MTEALSRDADGVGREPVPADAVLVEVAYLKSIRALGTNERHLKLFDYLVEASLEGRSPKETEISAAVFGNASSAPGGSVTRVYVFRLRRRLDEIYAHEGKNRPLRLSIPRGDYRLAADRRADPDAPSGEDGMPRKRPLSRILDLSSLQWVLAAAAALVVTVNVGLWVAWAAAPREADKFAASPLWADIAADDGPLLLVVGDYYLFGEYEDRVMLKRLIRDPSINSKSDLINQYMHNHEQYEKYADVATRYLPASTGFALADLAPLIDRRSNVQVKMASDLTPHDLKASDVIYVGLLNGLGPLQDRVFAQSRYAVDGTYNEITDRQSGEIYMSEATFAAPTDTMYRDYGFISSFKGVSGNRIIVLTGVQDTALIGMATKLTNAAYLRDLKEQSSGAADMEALFEVKGQRKVDLQTQLLGWSAVDSEKVWAVAPIASAVGQ